uniref:Uncharacterized protein n=1 Tax=Octactis speculum TaxID=3111310 RepID=A0A6U3SRN5_9STRA
MTRQLAGILWRCSQKSKLEQDTLANDPGLLLSTAKANLASMDHVLIYENKESIPDYLRCAFGCLVPVSLPDELYNSRGNKKKDSHVALDVTQEIGAHNALDKELYDFAEQLYKKSRCATYQHKHSVQ